MKSIAKLSFFFTIYLLVSQSVFSSELEVANFELQANSTEARTHPRKDSNDAFCALIKVQTVVENVTFSGAVIGDIDNKINEYWVYVSPNIKSIQVISEENALEVRFADFGIEKVESRSTYILRLKVQTDNPTLDSELSIDSSPADFQVKAMAGDVLSMLKLGKCYSYGHNTEENITLASMWFEKAASCGNAEAQYLIGEFYYTGNAHTQNYEKAFEYFSKSASQGYKSAYLALARCYENGFGVKKNMKQARKYKEMAASK